MMPGRSEKTEIIRGMRETFDTRQKDRQKQLSMSEIIRKFPHLASYDGEIVSSLCSFALKIFTVALLSFN